MEARRHLLSCGFCGANVDRLINYYDADICKECFLEKKQDEAIDQFEDESFDWYDYDD